MNTHKTFAKIKLNLFDLVVISLTIIIIFIATLYPFNFSLLNSFSVVDLITSFNNSSSFEDMMNNILLFMPLGFFGASFFQKLRVPKIMQIFLIFLASMSLSVTVEVLQIFLPSRTPTPADIFNNTFGGCLGLICFYIWNIESFRDTINTINSNKLRNLSKKFGVFLLAYLLSTLLIAIIWQGTFNLSNWHFNYHLVLGNEYTGDRPWQGYISEIQMSDRAISTHTANETLIDSNHLQVLGDALLINYQFHNYLPTPTLTAPELSWQGNPTLYEVGKGIFLSSKQWLKTAQPVKDLSQKISESSEFTLNATIATDKYLQTGPARIISISGSSLRRNLTLSQDGQDLDLRLRTPITGENGSDIQLTIPDVFIDKKPHQILITYAKANLKIYIDKIQRAYVFNLLELIPFHRRVIYYALTFIPLGIGLTMLTLLAKTQLIFSQILVCIGILLPSFILEGLLISKGDKHLSWKNVILGIVLTAGTMLFFKLRSAHLRVKN
ncbi:MAG TPA: VanZ family protein [Nostocaceae cyanobacterium]|nr:VanZ family protein [Nostocaceae cyanobacterium]